MVIKMDYFLFRNNFLVRYMNQGLVLLEGNLKNLSFQD